MATMPNKILELDAYFRTEKGRQAYATKQKLVVLRHQCGKAIDPEFKNSLPLAEAEIYYSGRIREKHNRWEALERKLARQYAGKLPHTPLIVTRDNKAFIVPEWDLA